MRSRRNYSSSSFLFLGYLPVLLVLAAVWAQSIAFAQEGQSKLKLDTGQEIWEAACAGCHGVDGAGQPVSTLGFEPPATFPDFTDCNGSTRESTLQWSSVIHDGGRSRSFVEIMPSFGPRETPALSDEQIQKVIAYARKFCEEDPKWPSGDFNFARPMVTDKSFPEDEAVLLTSINTDGTGFDHELIVEKRFGAANNFEVRFRGAFAQTPAGSWIGAVGDTSLELKRVLFLRNWSGSILTWGNELNIPTGDSRRGLGSGVTSYESFLTFGQILPKTSFIQLEAGAEAPFRRHQSPSEVFLRTAVGKAFMQDRGFGRAWSPGVELAATRAFASGRSWTLDLVPQLQMTLSKRQHIRLGMGVTVPVLNTTARTAQAMFYLLWDTFDGGLFEGWR